MFYYLCVTLSSQNPGFNLLFAVEESDGSSSKMEFPPEKKRKGTNFMSLGYYLHNKQYKAFTY